MVIKSSDYIFVNEISSETVGLYIDTPPVPPMAQQRYTTYQTGTDTDSVSPDDTFENIKIPVKAYQFFPESFDNRSVYAFLANANTLRTSRFENFYYKVKKVSVSEPTTIYNGQRIQYTINFECEPFKYAVDNPMTDVDQNGIVDNNGNRYSRPVWTITATGDVILFVNGVGFTIYNMENEPVAIDCEKMLAYTSNQIINNQTNGYFPLLSVGQNIVSWQGDVSRVTVQKNERWY